MELCRSDAGGGCGGSSRGVTAMKSKLSAALAAGACVLAVSPANAVTVASHRGAITSSVPGAVLFDDFDSVQNTAIGTITGGLLCSGVDFGCGGTFGTPPATEISSGWIVL